MAKRPVYLQWWDKVPPTFKNKYFLFLALFALWMLFLDKHDVITQFRLQRTVQELKEDKRFYETRIEEEEERRRDLEQNSEKYARERYFMKKRNEDVYILVKD